MSEKIILYDMDRVFLISLLLVNLEKDRLIFITYEGKEKIFENLKGEKVILKKDEMYSKFSILNRFKMASYIKKIRKNLAPILNKVKSGEVKIYGMDNLELGRRVFYKEKIEVIEEGVLNYMPYEVSKPSIKTHIQDIISAFYGLGERKVLLGYGGDIERVYLTENLCQSIPKELEEKAQVINLKKLWEQKSEKEREIILKTFAFDREILKKVDKNSILLFTQPLSEDGLFTEEEKISLYSKVMKKYPEERVIIKAHPREKTDYSRYFKKAYVMKEKYPIELLTLMGIEIKKAVTLFSTAVFGLGKDVEIDFYGTEVDEKLFKRFGSCDSIMKRNVFLDEVNYE